MKRKTATFTITAFLAFSSVFPDDIEEVFADLESLLPALLRRYDTPGAQLHIFEGDRTFDAVFGTAGEERDLTEKTLFQAGELVRPLVAYGALLEFGQAPERPLSEFEAPEGLAFPNAEKATLADLLGMTSGLPASGLAAFEGSLEEYLRGRLSAKDGPGERIGISFDGYGYLQLLLERRIGKGFEPWMGGLLGRFGMEGGALPGPSASPGFKSVRGRFFPMDLPPIVAPASGSLFTTAGDYGRFVRRLLRGGPVAERLLSEHFAYDAALGGVSFAGHFLRSPEGTVHRIAGNHPGYCSLALFSSGGRGAVLFANGYRTRFCTDAGYHLLEWLFPGFVPKGSARAADFGELEGYYRPEGLLPEQVGFFSFLNDLRLRKNDAGGAGLEAFFDRKPNVELLALPEKDLFVARGNTQMHGWRLAVRRGADGEVTGMDTDLIRYRKVPMYLSAPARIAGLAALALLPLALLFLFMYLRARSST